MANSTKVTSTTLRNNANSLRDEARNFQTQYQQILQIGGELDRTWDGDASQKFMSQISTDQEQFLNMYNTLMQYADAMDASANIYDEGEDGSVNIIVTRTAR